MNNEYKTIIAEITSLDITEDDIKDEMILVDDLAFESLAFVGMIVSLERTYGIKFDDEFINMEKLKTVHDVAEYIRIKTEQKG